MLAVTYPQMVDNTLTDNPTTQLLLMSSEWLCDALKGEGGAKEQKGGATEQKGRAEEEILLPSKCHG